MEQQTFPATLDSLEPIRDFVAKAAGHVGLDRTAAYNLCLAVDEIATNVVIHGYEEAGLNGNLKIAADVDGNKLVIRLEDQGKAYDPNAHEVPSAPDLEIPLEDREIGGLGILLAKNAVEELQYTTGDLGNVHRFVVKLPKEDI